MNLTEGGRFGADEVLAVDFDEAVVRLRIPNLGSTIAQIRW